MQQIKIYNTPAPTPQLKWHEIVKVPGVYRPLGYAPSFDKVRIVIAPQSKPFMVNQYSAEIQTLREDHHYETASFEKTGETIEMKFS